MLIRLFDDYEGNLLPFADVICKLSEALINIHLGLTDKSSLSYESKNLSTILLRVYEQAESQKNAECINQCLDIWDKLLENNIGEAKELTELIEK